jgi:predicted ATP-dependent endonuclease of OLD family
MKIVSLTIENFRSYRNPVTVSFNDLTVLIGKNDIGKSTILEALDIFFENRKIDSDDVNIDAKANGETVKLTVVFSNLPNEIDLDSGAKTDLKEEFLLNEKSLLEIKKDFTSLTKPKTYICCNHPSNENANDLHSLKIKDLQKRVKDLNIEGDFKANVKNEMRKAIWNQLKEDLTFEYAELEISQEGVKDIWIKVFPLLPVFALFQSDRKNDEKDKEVQDPLKVAAEQALKKHIEALNEIKKKVEEEVAEIANLTIDKLKEMNKEVAQQLKPNFPAELKWTDLFKPTLTSDDIPMNKRGSGVRRLLLINFFRAEAERKRKEKNAPNVIYAIEEPETSQHPDWQRKLMDALKELSENGTAQIVTTTHSPALASLVNVEDLRFIFRENSENKIEHGNSENLQQIADTLGVLPSLEKKPEDVKVFLCVEGPTDIDFFNNISPLFGVDLINDKRIVAISLGGGTLGQWVTHNYLKKLKKSEVHIYDKDTDNKYQKFVNEVNERGLNHFATLTDKREIENYFHESIVISSFKANDGYEINITIDDSSDISEVIAKARHEARNPDQPWESQGKRYKEKCLGFVKKHLNTETAKLLTTDILKQRNALDEINGWFEEIKKRLN